MKSYAPSVAGYNVCSIRVAGPGKSTTIIILAQQIKEKRILHTILFSINHFFSKWNSTKAITKITNLEVVLDRKCCYQKSVI